MKKIPQTVIGISMAVLLFTASYLPVYSQKLKNIQEGNIWAPANVKIDGKLNDWGSSNFQAFNNATGINYTIGNDQDNLYLVIKCDDQINSSKIIGGGINFTINTAGKKKEKDAFVVAFPVPNMDNLRNMMQRFGGGQTGMPSDSTVNAMKKQSLSTFKEIKLSGFKDIPDSVISIYNNYDLKVGIDFDSKGSLVVEMKIPLKFLSVSVDKAAEMAYNIKLNAIQIPNMPAGGFGGGPGGPGGNRPGGGFGGGPGGGGGFSGGGGQLGGGMPAGMMAGISNMLSPTDFWGKYTLAKK